MKRCASIVILLFLCSTASSQVLIALLFGEKLNNGTIEFGLMTGPGFTNLTNSNASTRTGINLGLYFNFKISENFFLHPEAIPKSSLGGKNIPFYPTGDPEVNSLFSDATIDRRIKAISVPLLARYRIYKSIFVEAGPQLDWQIKIKDIYRKDASDGNELTYTAIVTKEFNWLSMGMAGGLAWKFKDKPSSMSLAVRYYYGLTDIQKSAGGTQSHRGAFVFVYIPVGSNKSEKSKPKP